MIYNLKINKSPQEPEDPQQKEYVTAEQVGAFLGTFIAGPLVLMLCWNYVVPYLFAVKTINYLHAFCIIVILNFIKND